MGRGGQSYQEHSLHICALKVSKNFQQIFLKNEWLSTKFRPWIKKEKRHRQFGHCSLLITSKVPPCLINQDETLSFISYMPRILAWNGFLVCSFLFRSSSTVWISTFVSSLHDTHRSLIWLLCSLLPVSPSLAYLPASARLSFGIALIWSSPFCQQHEFKLIHSSDLKKC